MAPPAKKIEQALVKGTKDVYRDDPDTITVNKVRQHVAEELELDDEFFSEAKWKAKSKTIIKEAMDKLLEGTESEAEPAEKPKKGTKRQSPEASKPAPKRQRKEKKQKVDDEDDDEEDADVKPSPLPEVKATVEKSDDEDDANDAKQEDSPSSDDADKKPTPQEEEEEEFSDVIDEDPAPKRKSAPKKEKEPKAKKAKAPPKEKKEAGPLDPQQEEIKKLQGHLVKCGVRKVWGNELKKYGTDSKAKIKHLKGMLNDVGMDGRFSEQKAREIKERRELMADVEAATEMNELWGDSKPSRRTRGSRGRSMKEDDSGSEDEGGAVVKGDGSDEEMNNGSGDEGEGEGGGFAARKRRAQADLAFLGDDSDSD